MQRSKKTEGYRYIEGVEKLENRSEGYKPPSHYCYLIDLPSDPLAC